MRLFKNVFLHFFACFCRMSQTSVKLPRRAIEQMPFFHFFYAIPCMHVHIYDHICAHMCTDGAKGPCFTMFHIVSQPSAMLWTLTRRVVQRKLGRCSSQMFSASWRCATIRLTIHEMSFELTVFGFFFLGLANVTSESTSFMMLYATLCNLLQISKMMMRIIAAKTKCDVIMDNFH